MAAPGDVSKSLQYDKRFGLDPDDWRYLLTRCHVAAKGGSIEATRKGMGWTRSRFQDGWRRAAAQIADGLNRERGLNAANIQAAEDAHERLIESGQIIAGDGALPPLYRRAS